MKLSNYVLPYPVLGLEGDFNDSIVSEHSMSLDVDVSTYTFNVIFNVADPDIIRLINDGKAVYSCEVDSPRTFFRKSFEFNSNSFSIPIKRTDLLGKVSFFFSVVTKENIQNYKNSNFEQKYYANYSFNLRKGDLLAYCGEETMNADIKFDELKSLGSLMEVKPDLNKNFTHFDFASDKIRIFLPTDEYNNFRKSNTPVLQDISHASIVQCALISALHSYEKYENTTWAEVLKIRVQNDTALKAFNDLNNLDSAQIAELVSILLENPNKRMFDQLKDIMSNDN